MDDSLYRRFFLEPADDPQRLYEALRAVFVDGYRQKDVAQRFGFPFDAFRQRVRQFRSTCDAGQPPPFSAHAHVGGPRRRQRCRRPRPDRRLPPSRIAAAGT
jgi:transposase-like protein